MCVYKVFTSASLLVFASASLSSRLHPLPSFCFRGTESFFLSVRTYCGDVPLLCALLLPGNEIEMYLHIRPASNVVQIQGVVLDVTTPDGVPRIGIVMEFCEHGSLRQHLKKLAASRGGKVSPVVGTRCTPGTSRVLRACLCCDTCCNVPLRPPIVSLCFVSIVPFRGARFRW